MKRAVAAALAACAGIGFAAPAYADESSYLQEVRAKTSHLFSASNDQLLQLGRVACAIISNGPGTPQAKLPADEFVARAAYNMGLMTGLAGSRFVTDAADNNLC
jgi:hypothetical protein